MPGSFKFILYFIRCKFIIWHQNKGWDLGPSSVESRSRSCPCPPPLGAGPRDRPLSLSLQLLFGVLLSCQFGQGPAQLSRAPPSSSPWHSSLLSSKFTMIRIQNWQYHKNVAHDWILILSVPSTQNSLYRTQGRMKGLENILPDITFEVDH